MQIDTMTTYICDNCRTHFTRYTNMEPMKRVPCTNSHCEGWMYPVENGHEGDYYSPIGRAIDKIIDWFKR